MKIKVILVYSKKMQMKKKYLHDILYKDVKLHSTMDNPQINDVWVAKQYFHMEMYFFSWPNNHQFC